MMSTTDNKQDNTTDSPQDSPQGEVIYYSPEALKKGLFMN